MVGPRFGICIALALALAFAPAARAFTPTVTSTGTPVHWKGRIKLNLAGNPTNTSGLSEDDVRTAVVHSLERWQQASDGAVSFDYWQGTDDSIYQPDSDYNGLSSVYFASHEKGAGAALSASILGLTQVWYNTGTGEILETDIVFNDRDFRFSTGPDQDGGPNGPTVFFENVVTHELGHALGLSHSAGLNSTMLYMESSDQAHLGCDEQVAIHSLYPTADAGARGALAGSVTAPDGTAIFGAQVSAISRARGTVLASGMTGPDGRYRIDALEPGTYYLMAEPFFAGPDPLPTYYAGMQQGICAGGNLFGRTPLTDATGFGLAPVEVAAGGGDSAAPAIVARCGTDGGAMIAPIVAAETPAPPPVIYDGASGAAGNLGFGAADRFSAANTGYYQLRALSGNLELHALTYSLFSPVAPTLSLLDAAGNPVPAAVQAHAYEGDGGFVDYDSLLTAAGLAPGDYTVVVQSSPLSSTLYPAGMVELDSAPFLILVGQVNATSAPAFAATLPTNARCRATERFEPYAAPPGNPPRRASAGGDGGGAFCAPVETKDRSPRGPGAILGWCLPWLAMLAATGFRKRRAALARASAKS